MKSILVVGDTHCGNRWGLLPPSWWMDKQKQGMSAKLWQWYRKEIENMGKVDVLLLTADLIDGPGRKSTTDHVTTNPSEQREIALEALDIIPRDATYSVRGTPYHVTTFQEEEDQLLKDLGGEIYNELDIFLGGKKINVYHTGKRSDNPKGPPSALWHEVVREQLQADIDGGQSPDIIIRAHTHYFFHVENRTKHAISTPALQMPFKGEYPRKLHTQYYDIGMVLIEINEKTGDVFVRGRIAPIKLENFKGVIHVG